MNKAYTIYKHTCPSGKVYIGMTCATRLNDRWKNGKGYKTCVLFNRAIEKYGWGSFKHEILFTGLSRAEAEAKEIEQIKQYRSDDPQYGYNIECGGYGVGKHSPETLKKMSENRKGKCVGKDNPFYNKHHSKEWIESHLCGENNPMYGVTGEKHPRFGIRHTQEALNKMKDAKKGKYVREKNPRAIKVECVETGEIFNCIKDASERTGVHQACISDVIRGRRKSAGGLHWRKIK